ncbi:hypothetical protein VD0002_g1250 [Verticillium dahliae]|nr:hypothetical protein VD0003_g3081 [Verticillium dahliae]PNH68943.1 hypothetical protein VD0002_g1250 [Verticillium dahliae]
MKSPTFATIVAFAFGTVAVLGQGDPAPRPPSSRLRVILNPARVRALDEPDFKLWTITGEPKSVSTTFGDTSITVAAANSTIAGASYKWHYTRRVAPLGERVVAQGISTNTDDAGNKPMTISITGLPAGKHSLLTWHNAWDSLKAVASVTVKVNGEDAETLAQSVRVDNIWESAHSFVQFTVSGANDTTNIEFIPAGADGRVFLNGFEIDTPDIDNVVSFPEPNNRDERVQLEGGDTYEASWRAPDAESPKYNVYIGTSPTELKSLVLGLDKTSTTLAGLDVFGTFYWRVDVVLGDEPYIGHAFMLRGAQLAFPGAEGYGRFARGGRGGRVVHVTSLEDSEEEGTLRYALAVARGPRYVVFDVGGVITTTSRMVVSDQYVTVAGQTAPGKGIIVQGHPLGLSGAIDAIFRHIKVRPGTVSGETVDAMGMAGSNHCIMDRCSMGWGIDENFSSRNAANITFQRSMISEPLNVAGHKNYPPGREHGFAATVSGNVGSLHHNLIAHAEGRSWSMGGGLDDEGKFGGRLDIRNNVVYNFGGYLTTMIQNSTLTSSGRRVTDGGAHEVNFVGNVYKQGPASNLTYALRAQYENQLPGQQQYYCEGNSMPGVFDQDSAQYASPDGTGSNKNVACWADVTISPAPSYRKFYDQPFFPSYVETQPSTEAYKRVLSDAGVSQPVVDNHDSRIFNETLTGTYTYKGSKSGKLGLIDNPADVGGLEDFPTVTREASWDADGDGIADWWDGSTGGDGYEPIEGYLNFMADPHAYVAPGKSVIVDLKDLFRGFEKKPTFTAAGAEKGSVEVQGSWATYTAGDDAGIDYIELTVKDSEGGSWTRTFGVAIFEGAPASGPPKCRRATPV